jgi:hypothetical protein
VSEEVVARIVELAREVREVRENANFRGLQKDI